MLCRVLSGRDAERAQLLGCSAALTRISPPPERGAAAEDEIRALRAQVQRLEAEVTAAMRSGHEAGRQQGEQKARSELAPVIERMNAALAELTGLRHDLRGKAEKDVVELSLLIAKRIIHRELNVDPGALTALARVVFERLARAECYRITTNPQFAEPLRGALSNRLLSKVEIDADPGCAPGTFVIRSEEGTIDASVDAQLEEISRGLTDRLAGS